MDIRRHIIDTIKKTADVDVVVGYIPDEATMPEAEKRRIAASMIEDIMQTVAKAQVAESEFDPESDAARARGYAGVVALSLSATLGDIERARESLAMGDTTEARKVLDRIPIDSLKLIVALLESI